MQVYTSRWSYTIKIISNNFSFKNNLSNKFEIPLFLNETLLLIILIDSLKTVRTTTIIKCSIISNKTRTKLYTFIITTYSIYIYILTIVNIYDLSIFKNQVPTRLIGFTVKTHFYLPVWNMFKLCITYKTHTTFAVKYVCWYEFSRAKRQTKTIIYFTENVKNQFLRFCRA